MKALGRLGVMRARAEARMESRVTVRRKTGEYVTNADGAQVPEWADIYTDLPARIAAGSTADGGSRGVTIGAATWENATGVASFPHPSDLLADGDLFEVTSGEWPDEVYQIVAAIKYDQQTARRVPIVEYPRPEEWA